MSKFLAEKIEVVNIKENRYDVYIGRKSKWGNPFSHLPNSIAKYKTQSRDESIEKYKEWITNGEGSFLLDCLDELLGKKLGCFCKPKKCHGDILKALLIGKYT